jgi:hypothetical protein
MLLLQIISYTEATHLEDQEEEGSQSGRFSENTSCVNSSFSAVKKSQSNFEGIFLKVGSTKDTSLLTEGSHVEDMDTSTIDNCDMVMPVCDTARKDRETQSYKKTERTGGCVQDGAARGLQSPSDSPDKSLNTSLQSDIELNDSTMTRNLLCTVVNEGNTLSDKLRNESVSCRTSDLSQDDFIVSDSADAERCFGRRSSVVPGGMSKVDEADESTKDDVDYPEKTDDEDVTFDTDTEYNSDSDSDIFDKTKDKKEAHNSLKFMSYNTAHKKCGLILCDFPTVSISLFKRVDCGFITEYRNK